MASVFTVDPADYSGTESPIFQGDNTFTIPANLTDEFDRMMRDAMKYLTEGDTAAHKATLETIEEYKRIRDSGKFIAATSDTPIP